MPRYKNDKGLKLHEKEIDYHNSSLKESYANSKGLLKWDYDFDEHNCFRITTISNNEKVFCEHNICAIATYGVICYDNLVSDNEIDLYSTHFRNQIDWLCNNVVLLEDNKAVWYYKYPNKVFYSAVAQGFVISALLRAYQLYKDEKYLDLATGAFRFLDTSVENGGLKVINGDFKGWYEEYLDLPGVLNGHIYTLLGIWDLYRVTKNTYYKDCFYDGVNAIKKNINHFNLGFFTKYSAFKLSPANNFYHFTHITQFLVLYKITGDTFFKEYAEIFDSQTRYMKHKFKNGLYLLKLYFKNKLGIK